MKIKLCFVLIAVLIANLLLSGVTSAQPAPTEVYVSPIITETTTCSEMTFGIWVKNVVDMTAFHLEIGFNPGSVEVTNVVNGRFLGIPTESALFEPTNGIYNGTGKILFGVAQQGTNGDPILQNGTGQLIEITLKAKTPGNLVPFMIDGEKSILVSWPDAFQIPFIVTGPGVVSTSSCAPTNITLSPSSIENRQPAGTEVGELKTTDPDSSYPWESWIYNLPTSYGDNALFAISGDKVSTRFTVDYGTKDSYSILVRSTDAGGKYMEKPFTIRVNYAPIIDPIPDQSAIVGELLAFTVTASNADLPATGLVFSLQNAPAGAVIDPATGDFTWTPSESQGDQDFTLKVCVSDGAATTCQELTIKVASAVVTPTGFKLYLPIIAR